MLRAILAVIGGYAALFVVLFVVFTAAFFALGTDGSFKEGSFEPSTTWIVINFPVGIVAAIVGGLVCVKIAGRPGPVRGLIGVIVVLGLLQVVGVMMAADPGPRSADLNTIEAMAQAVMPLWVAIANVVVGVVGVTLGARLGSGGATAPPAAPAA